MELSAEEKRRIYEEEKARLETQEQIRMQMEAEENAKKGKQAVKEMKMGCWGCLTIILVIILIAVLSSLLGKGGKNLSDVEYEASCYSESHIVTDTPDRKEWMVRFGGTAQMYIATKQSNGYWKTELHDLHIPVQ